MTSPDIIDPQKATEVAGDLAYIEAWCLQTNTAGSALGRHVLQDQAALSRWRAKGITGCSPEKRLNLANFVLSNPKGIPGYTKGRTGRAVGKSNRPSSRFVPGNGPASSRAGTLVEKQYQADIPTIPIHALTDETDIAYVKRKASERGVGLVQVLAELTTLGIRVARETEYEEDQEAQEEQERKEQ